MKWVLHDQFTHTHTHVQDTHKKYNHIVQATHVMSKTEMSNVTY